MTPLPTPAAYHAAVRRMRDDPPPHLQPLRIAIAASFTADPLGNYLIVEGAHRGFSLHPWFAPYNQFDLECSHPESALFAHHPDIVVLATRLDDLVPTLWHNDAGREQLAAEACDRIAHLVASTRRHSAASVLLFNFTEPARPQNAAASLIAYANRCLEQIARDHPGVVIFDFARFALESGLHHILDPRLEYVSRMPFGVAAQIALAGRLARSIRALRIPPRKCLVLDLDNTLWGGILGELGPGGIALGNQYPGRAFVDFQHAVRDLRRRGILLAIASKNNRAEVCEVFEHHPDMVLHWDDFAATQIHWEDKAASLETIASHLRIGLDSLAFYDDNPLEREWVRSRLPEVAVIEAPDDPLLRIAALDDCEVFDQTALSDEDRRRADLYQHDREREHARTASTSLADFLAELQIRIVTGPVDAQTLPRVAQLINKTNQFNLTARRYTEAELERQLQNEAIACWLRASDRFGDYGLVGAAFALPEGPGAYRIDNFVLSCRILGRQVETALLAALAKQIAAAGAAQIIGEYVPTPKNAPARDFYIRHGFQPQDDRWIWNFAAGPIQPPSWLTEPAGE